MISIPNRILKESITTSEDIAKLSQGAEILFYRLMVKADDYGAYFGNEQIVKSECFPLKADELKSNTVKKWLDELSAAGLIIRYVAQDGRKYLKLVKWEAHQQIRAKKSKFPQFDDTCNQLLSDDSNCKQLQANVPVIQSNPNTIQIQSESESNPSVGEYSDDFEIFWHEYPKKVGKKEAFKAFKRVKEPLSVLIAAVRAQEQSAMWNKENGRFIPNPATWLNQGRWDDMLPKEKNPFDFMEAMNDNTGNSTGTVIDILNL